MLEIVMLFLCCLARLFKTRIGLETEILALRHQLCVHQRSLKRPKFRSSHRVLWSLLSRVWPERKDALIFVKKARARELRRAIS